MTNSFNMSNWRRKYALMSETNGNIEEDIYQDNKMLIMKSILKNPSVESETDAEQIFDLMKADGLTQDEAITAFNEMIPDYRKDQGGEREDDTMPDDLMEEDIDLGHEDNEPHMIKADLYRIGKYAMELYAMADKLEKSGQEIDFPAWWQAMITDAKEQMVKAKHYLDFELNEPAINATVDTMSLYEKYTKA